MVISRRTRASLRDEKFSLSAAHVALVWAQWNAMG
jgi:hypothetical protein